MIGCISFKKIPSRSAWCLLSAEYFTIEQPISLFFLLTGYWSRPTLVLAQAHAISRRGGRRICWWRRIRRAWCMFCYSCLTLYLFIDLHIQGSSFLINFNSFFFGGKIEGLKSFRIHIMLVLLVKAKEIELWYMNLTSCFWFLKEVLVQAAVQLIHISQNFPNLTVGYLGTPIFLIVNHIAHFKFFV